MTRECGDPNRPFTQPVADRVNADSLAHLLYDAHQRWREERDPAMPRWPRWRFLNFELKEPYIGAAAEFEAHASSRPMRRRASRAELEGAA